MTSVINFINTGTSANAGNGDSLRTAFNKINANFIALENSYVQSGVSSFNGQGGIIRFTATEIASVLGFVPYSAANPAGYVTSATVQGFANLDYVNSNFVTTATGATFATRTYVDITLTQYPTLQFLTNARYVNASNISTFLTDYYTIAQLGTAGYITTSTLDSYLKITDGGDIIPSTTATYNIGSSLLTWNNLYLAGDITLNGATLSIDPTTNRLLVNGSDVAGGYVFTPSAIYSANSNTFSLSSNYDAISGNTGFAGIKLPSNVDIAAGASLLVYNTGTTGISITGKYSYISLDNHYGTDGIKISGNILTPTQFKNISTNSNEVSNLLFLPPNLLGNRPGAAPLISPQSIVSIYTGTNRAPLLVNAKSFVVTAGPGILYPYYDPTIDGTGGPPFVESSATYLGLWDSGLHIGTTRTINGAGDPNDTVQLDEYNWTWSYIFDGYRMPVTSGLPGQVLTQGPIVSGSTGSVVTQVYWSTATDANVNSQLATINTATIRKTFTLGTDGLRFNDGSLMVTAYGNQQVSDFLPQYSGALSVGYIAGLGTNVDIISNGLRWAFSATGVLSLPDGGQIGELYGNGVDIRANPSGYVKLVSNSGNNYITVDNLGSYIESTGNQWTFGTNGTLTLPEGSQISETAGVSTNITVNSRTWAFDIAGGLTFPDNTVQTTAYVNNRTTGSWTLATGANTVSITVPLNGNYQMWVNGNIPNGIVEWNATVNVSNPNVPAIGSQYAWYYATGNALVLTAIPDQIVGTVGVISSSTGYLGNTADVFTFGITNNSTSSQVINWGYTTL